jgi:hypothetical protein
MDGLLPSYLASSVPSCTARTRPLPRHRWRCARPLAPRHHLPDSIAADTATTSPEHLNFVHIDRNDTQKKNSWLRWQE